VHNVVVLLLCDLDGTVVDRDTAFLAWARSLAERHHESAEFVEWMVAKDQTGAWARRELFDLLRRRLHLETPPEGLADVLMSDFMSHFRCDADVREALTLVRDRGHKIAIVSNGGPTQTHKIKAADLDELVDAVCISSIEGVWKPDPLLLEIAAKRAGTTLDRAWLIGDSINDIKAASAAGISSVWMTHGRAWTEPDVRPTTGAENFSAAVAVALAAWDD
jgi:putative hydrolase of the HAD superfamily